MASHSVLNTVNLVFVLRVVVLDKGLIVEFDNPQTLLNKPKSVFALMAKDAGITAVTADKKKT